MKHLEDIQQEDEYTNRVLVFKCDLNSSQYYGVHHLAIYAAKCFKGTRKQFDQHLEKYFKGRNVVPYLVYIEQSKIDNVEHAGADRNIIYVNNNKAQKQRQSEYKYLKSNY